MTDTTTSPVETDCDLVTVEIDSDALRRLMVNGSIGASSDRDRPVLTNIVLRSVDAGHMQTVSTDSYMIVRTVADATVVGDLAGGVQVPADVAKALVALCKANKRSIRLSLVVNLVEDTLTVTAGPTQSTFKLASKFGEFPKVSGFFDDFKAADIGEVGLNLVLLARLAKLESVNLEARHPVRKVTFTLTEGNKAQRFSVGSDVDGVIMTVR